MPSTTIHFPDEILKEIDRNAKKNKISRNKYVIQACIAEISKAAGEWPEDFFSYTLDDADFHLLQTAVEEMTGAIYANRRNRGAPLL
jgi:predicted transcriptional regulator